MCKKCFQSTNKNITTFLTPIDNVNNKDGDDYVSDSDDDLIEPYNIDAVDNNNVHDNGDAEVDAEDDMEMFNEEVYGENSLPQNDEDQDLLTRSFDSDIPINVSDDIGLDDQCVSNEIPTTNTGEVAHCVDEKPYMVDHKEN